MTQLTIMIAILAALAFGSASGGTTTNNASKGINPVQHSEKGINPVQHSE